MFGAISLSSGKSILFIPRLPESYKIWCGALHPPSYFRDLYDVDEVLFVEEIFSWLKNALESEGKGSYLHLLDGVNSDSDLNAKQTTFTNIEEFTDKICTKDLFNALSTSRVTKSNDELNLMKYCAFVASNAHVEVMRSTLAGMMEYELEATFLYQIYKKGGCRRAAYTSICACGPNGAVLHYGHAGAPNNRQLQQGDMALLDMGAEYHGYTSDITCSFPVSGRFSADQRAVYEAVLNAQRAVVLAVRPGAQWSQCHLLAERAIVAGLIAAGVLIGRLDEVVEAQLGPVFFPHGLGHLIGCDTHDVGGYLPDTPARSSRPGLAKLRTARQLLEGMTLTNEPGCYFIDTLLDAALADPTKAQYINKEVLQRFRGFGGVRLEDVIAVTADGCANYTTCPRTVAEVEAVLAGGSWPPVTDEAPELQRVWMRLAADGLAMEPIALGGNEGLTGRFM